jgi:hypothetical protein
MMRDNHNIFQSAPDIGSRRSIFRLGENEDACYKVGAIVYPSHRTQKLGVVVALGEDAHGYGEIDIQWISPLTGKPQREITRNVSMGGIRSVAMRIEELKSDLHWLEDAEQELKKLVI